MPISDTTRQEAQRLVQRYPVARSALLPLLHLVQSDEGYVSEDGIAFCADALNLTKAEVAAVSTFYTMFKREPFGDYLLSVCTNPTCKIAGAQDIYESYVERCGGHIDRDAGVMVEHAECLGICDAAPVVQINYEMYGPVTHDEAMDLLDKAKAGDPPPSNWSNEVPGTFRQVERQLAGVEDGTDEYLIEAARLQALTEAAPAYRTGETDIPVTHPGGDPAGHGGAAFRAEARLDGGVGDTRGQLDRQRDQMAPATAEELDEVAQRGGVEAELADQVQDPVDESPAVQDQPRVPAAGGTGTPQEAEPDRPAVGTEADPQDSTAGEQGLQSAAGTDEEPPSGRAEDSSPLRETSDDAPLTDTDREEG